MEESAEWLVPSITRRERKRAVDSKGEGKYTTKTEKRKDKWGVGGERRVDRKQGKIREEGSTKTHKNGAIIYKRCLFHIHHALNHKKG